MIEVNKDSNAAAVVLMILRDLNERRRSISLDNNHLQVLDVVHFETVGSLTASISPFIITLS